MSYVLLELKDLEFNFLILVDLIQRTVTNSVSQKTINQFSACLLILINFLSSNSFFFF